MNFRKLVLDSVERSSSKEQYGIETPLEKYNNKVGHIEAGKLIAVAGRPNSGKVSFMDHIYLFSILEHHYKQLEVRRDVPPLKIFYVGTKTTLKNKFQEWLCLYLKLKHQILLDIPTLNNAPGRMCDLTPEILELIRSAEEYFEYIEEVVEYMTGHVLPTDVYNKVTQYLNTMGEVRRNGYHEHSEYLGQQTYVFIDNMKRLTPESDGVSTLTGNNLIKRMKNYLLTLCNVYNVTCVACISTENTGIIRTPKDTEPNYRDLGIFTEDADIGIVLYNPWVERNNNYLDYAVQDFVIRGKDRLRSVNVVRNTISACNFTIPLFFLGECGYFSQAPLPDSAELEQKLAILKQIK